MTTPASQPALRPDVDVGSGKRVGRAFIAVLVVASIAMVAVGWMVAGKIRGTAAETDRRLRTLAWATMSYVTANDGAFPLSIEELKAFGLGGETIALAPDADDTPWPTTRTAAMAGAQPSTYDEALVSIVVVFGDARDVPPYLKPDGLPTTVGTSAECNEWLKAMRARYLRRGLGLDKGPAATPPVK